MKYFECWSGYLTSEQSERNEWDILFNTRNKFYISTHLCMLCLLYKLYLLSPKIKQYILMRIMVIGHMWRNDINNSHVYGINTNKTVHFLYNIDL